MMDHRVPGTSIAEGRRRPVMLSSAAVDDFANLEERAKKSLVAKLKRLAAGTLQGTHLLTGSLGEQGYKSFKSGDLRAVYRDLSPEELMKQGFEERVARKGGIFVLDILPAHEPR
ncbi:hypothetical protein ACIQTW_21460 [Paenarthrobacter sp. NPDC090517]|uniref:hypothetical protein n=1 Tax=Paenarthrobacter sp. NPDC090517 TaxID=3364381 RepID=UPI003806EDCB